MRGAGYTKFANSILQALPHIRACAGVKDTYLAILRLTVGWQVKERVLGYTDICILTGYSRGMQYNYVKQALKLNMITRYLIGTDVPRYCYAPVLDPHEWKVSWRITPKDYSRLLTRLVYRTHRTQVSRKHGTPLSRIHGTDILGIIIDTPIQ